MLTPSSDREFFTTLNELKRPENLLGMLPLRWHPRRFSELLGIPVGGAKNKLWKTKKDVTLRRDVAFELETNLTGFFFISGEAELRERHPELKDYYDRYPEVAPAPSLRTGNRIGFSDILSYLSEQDVHTLFDIDRPDRYFSLLRLMHQRADQPLLTDIIFPGQPVYRRELVHLLSCPDVPEWVLHASISEHHPLRYLCEQAGIYDIYPYLP